ncbi:MAG: VTT domain-containing protein [Candidatus Absconditabacteria bacterium]|nr:VTT domain-containing protein [Candidatus Absconditabacteria bacterium]
MFWQIIKHNIYLYLLILTTIEGPITSFISAGVAAQGGLRIEYVAIIAFLGDIIGDILLYSIGRFSNKIPFLKKVSYIYKDKHFLTKALNKTPFIYFLVAKFTPYLSAPSLIFAGARKFDIKRFLFYSFIISVFVKTVYLTIGYLGSVSLKQLTSFLEGRQQIAGYVIGGLILFFITKHIYFNLGKRIKNKSEETTKSNP